MHVYITLCGNFLTNWPIGTEWRQSPRVSQRWRQMSPLWSWSGTSRKPHKGCFTWSCFYSLRANLTLSRHTSFP